MRILVDLTACNKGYSLGVYISRILNVWKSYKYLRIILLIKEDMINEMKLEYPGFEYVILEQYSYRNKFQSIFKYKWLVDSLIWRNTVNRQNVDILYSPTTFFHFFWKVRVYRVLTIHDLHMLRVWKGKDKFVFCLFSPLLLINVNKIIAITDFVKRDILKTYPFISEKKIRVIYNGVSLPAIPLESNNMEIEGKYLLYVNTLHEYKNIATLVKAFISLKNDISHKLVIVGRSTSYWREAVLPLIEQAGIKERVVHISDYVTDEYLAILYRSADIFISPSLHEGFGYTPVEAAIWCTPVICTKETSLPEVTMGLVNYYEPSLDYLQLKNKILEVLNNYPSESYLKMVSNKFMSQYDSIQQGRKIYDYLVDCIGK